MTAKRLYFAVSDIDLRDKIESLQASHDLLLVACEALVEGCGCDCKEWMEELEGKPCVFCRGREAIALAEETTRAPL